MRLLSFLLLLGLLALPFGCGGSESSYEDREQDPAFDAGMEAMAEEVTKAPVQGGDPFKAALEAKRAEESKENP